jgi:hypothetical protein
MGHKVLVHEWALDTNIGLENLSFRIACITIMMHCYYPQASFYVFVTCISSNKSLIIFEDNVLKQQSRLNQIKKQFLAQDAVDALTMVHSQY